MVDCVLKLKGHPANATIFISFVDPPSAVVNGQNVTSVADSLSIDCLATNGNPNNYTFSPWQHRWHDQNNILREMASTNIENNKAILKLENLTFQDSGYYKCFVSNGIGILDDNEYMAADEVFLFIKGKVVSNLILAVHIS